MSDEAEKLLAEQRRTNQLLEALLAALAAQTPRMDPGPYPPYPPNPYLYPRVWC